MGRINNSVEIIPIDGPSGLHSRQISREVRTQPQYLQRVKTMPYISDPYIVARVQQYLEMNVDRTFVDIAEMADYLQKTYREYGKRKRSAFRGMVKKAYAIISRNYGNKASSSESDVEDLDDEAEEQNNSMNNQLILMYNNRPGQQQQQQLSRNLQHLPQPTASEEAIDISSDEESDNIEIPPVPPLKKENGPPPPLKLPKLVEMSSSSTASVEKIVTSTPQQPDRIKKRKSDQTQVIYPKRKKDAETETKVTFQDVGGMDKVLEDVCKLLVHIKHPEVYRQIGITPPRGFLLHGPPGCGKTLLANAIAGELDVAFIKVAAPELVAGVSGESEGRIRELFERAVTTAPCVLFIDEIDAITQNRQQAQKEMERRIVAQLLSCLDELGNNENGDRVLVIGATNRPDSLDPALRRAGRFDREVCLGIPNLEAREQILRVLTSKLKLTPDFDYKYIAKNSPGYVGADLMALTREAAMAAIDRVFSHLNTPILSKSPTPTDITEPIIVLESNEAKDATKEDVINTEEVKPVQDAVTQTEKTQEVIEIPTTTTVSTTSIIPEAKRTTVDQLITWLHGQAPLTTDQLNELSIEMVDFRNALKSVQPSAKREGFATVPGVTWEDVGSLQDIREELQMSILAPVRYPEQFKSLGITTPAGVLLCGPPGCGKTLLAKAIANEAGINFISVKGPELLNMYVGESERAVRQCFQRARSSVPCVIFFDELDALCPKRSDSGEGGASMRVVNQMLTEMDGIEDRAGVFLMAASNRPDIVDPAVLRPGRLDKILYVGLPTPEDRVDILRAITKKGTQPLLAPDVDLEAIGKCEPCNGYTGADLAALVREAGIQAMKDLMLNTTPAVAPITLSNDHFQKAILKIRPSVTEKDQKHYEKIRKQYIRIKDVAGPTEEEIMECS